jgi:hypothetical protein
MCDACIVDKAAVSSVGVEIVSYSLLFLVDVESNVQTLNITSLRLTAINVITPKTRGGVRV